MVETSGLVSATTVVAALLGVVFAIGLIVLLFFVGLGLFNIFGWPGLASALLVVLAITGSGNVIRK